jgi:hypothetical protein
LGRVPVTPDFFHDPIYIYLAQNPPEAVTAAVTADPSVEEHNLKGDKEEEEVLEEAYLQEFLALEDKDNDEMDFDGLDTTDHKTSAGKEGNNAPSTKCVYSCIHRFYGTFLAKLEPLDVVVVVNVVVSNKDLYLLNKAAIVNHKLVCIFIMWYIQKTSPTRTTSLVSEALMFVQSKLRVGPHVGVLFY